MVEELDQVQRELVLLQEQLKTFEQSKERLGVKPVLSAEEEAEHLKIQRTLADIAQRLEEETVKKTQLEAGVREVQTKIDHYKDSNKTLRNTAAALSKYKAEYEAKHAELESMKSNVTKSTTKVSRSEKNIFSLNTSSSSRQVPGGYRN